MHVVAGSASTELAERIARALDGAPFIVPFTKRFPDGELYVRVGGELKDQAAVLVQSTRSDRDVIELLLLSDAIREAGARRLYLVVPYFGYGRQDRPFLAGEPMSARALARVVESSADGVVTVDLHSSATLQSFRRPAFEASGIPALARLLKGKTIDLLVSPDGGGIPRAQRLAGILEKPWMALDKQRIDSERVELTLPKGKVPRLTDQNVVIVDDIISTGGTVVEAAKLLRRQGARTVAAGCTHGLFLRDAFERIKAVTNELFSTDTVRNPAEQASVAPEVALILRQNCASL